MKLREVAPLVLMVVLGGCGGADLDQAFNYVGIGGKDEQAPPPSQQPAASAGETAPLSTPEAVAATTRPWTPVGALSPSSRAAMAEPLPPPAAAAAEPVPPPRPRVVASVPPTFTPPVPVPAPIRPQPRTVAAAPEPVRSEPPPVVAPAPNRPAPRTVAAAPAPIRSQPRTVAAAPEPVWSEPPPVVAPAPIRSQPRTVAVAPAPIRSQSRTVVAPVPIRPAPQTVAVAAAPSIVEPPPAAPAADPWCSRIAQSASADAASQGFDAATQRHRAEVTYNQCVGFAH
jgi:hypothetical protein